MWISGFSWRPGALHVIPAEGGTSDSRGEPEAREEPPDTPTHGVAGSALQRRRPRASPGGASLRALAWRLPHHAALSRRSAAGGGRRLREDFRV